MKSIKWLIVLGLIANLTCYGMQSAMTMLQSAGKSLVTEAIISGKIIAGSIGAACLYGVAKDQITARIFPGFFNKGINRASTDRMPASWLRNQMQSDSPTRLGFSWGIMASWWMGAVLSIPVLLASRAGCAPRLTMSDLAVPTGVALTLMGACSAYDAYNASSREWIGNNKKYHIVRVAHAGDLTYGALAGLGITAYAIANRMKRA